jgi:peptide/nickel transport system substrate-binding protein
VAVERGQSDFSEAGLDIATARRHVSRTLETQYSQLAHFVALSATDFLVPNTTLPPFDDVRVRRALSFAIDRKRIVELAGGQLVASPTCQVLPPGFEGYRPYCPYTRGGAGRWTAPDLTRARKLVAASGTKGMSVTLWTDPVLNHDDIARYVMRVLRRLGYKPTLKLVASDELLYGSTSPVVKRPGVQLTIVAWIPDYRGASDFFGWGWCNWGFGWFCDRHIDGLMKTATTSPDKAVAAAKWTRIDHRIVDLAPVIPLTNLNALDVVSSRVGNYQFSPILRVLLEQMWVH